MTCIVSSGVLNSTHSLVLSEQIKIDRPNELYNYGLCVCVLMAVFDLSKLLSDSILKPVLVCM